MDIVGYFTSNQEDFYEGHYQNVLSKQSGEMDSPEFSLLSSLRGEFKHEDFIQPHYKESYRLAIDCLVKDGRDSYHEFLKGERVGSFLSEDEILFITSNAEQLPSQNQTEEVIGPSDNQSSSGTYWPTHSDVETPNLDLGWPNVLHEKLPTNISLLYHPPRLNNPTIKEVIRKNIQDARQVIAIVMDKFTDVDIFKEAVDASIRGVPVYVLLDDYHFKSFLKMADNQDIKLQQLRNMRVRIVKGQDYLCRSGAKFHGSMEQKFLLVDCHTAIYGSYSLTWSFEKIHLSMVQVITGQLVKSYDEEFRTLYARSIVPAELGTPVGGSHNNRLHGQEMLPRYDSAPKIRRWDQLRHSLDVVNRKTYERKSGTRGFEDRLIEENGKTLGPLMKGPQFEPESFDEMNLLKRHSYAGKRQDGCLLQNMRPRGSNWNISRDAGILSNNYSMDNYVQVPQIHRGQNMRQSYNGNDNKQVLSMQQNMPTLESTSKSFMRTLRIESYLKNHDASSMDTCDYLDQFETMDKASSFMQGHMRNSIALRCPIPEHIEPNTLINPSLYLVGRSAAPNTPLHYTSMQWEPGAAAESRINSSESMLMRQSPQTLDNFDSTANYGPGRNHSTYSSLSRSKRGQIITNPNMLADSWQKRHSMADPRSSTEHTYETSGHMYGHFVRTEGNRSTAEIPAQNGGYRSNMNEDQRSLSHYDVKNITDKKGPSTHIWHEPPSRTVSAAALHLTSKDLANKSSSMNSQHIPKNSSKKMQSLVNIPGRKDFKRTMETPSLTSSDSCDTITADDDEVGGKHQQSATSSNRSSSEHPLRSSKPQLKTEEHQDQPANSPSKTTTEKKPLILRKNIKSAAESRVYSRFEPFCSLERKSCLLSGSRRPQSQEKLKSLSKGEAAVQPSHSQATRGHQENKLEKFFHRVGNMLNKNK